MSGWNHKTAEFLRHLAAGLTLVAERIDPQPGSIIDDPTFRSPYVPRTVHVDGGTVTWWIDRNWVDTA